MDYSQRELLISYAKGALAKSYAPFSNFKVGVAILCDSGDYITAGNVEFAVSAIGVCAERLALSQARMSKKNPTHIAICSHHNGEIKLETMPCGLCRQAMVEFKDLKLVNTHSSRSVRFLLPKPYEGRKART